MKINNYKKIINENNKLKIKFNLNLQNKIKKHYKISMN